MAEPAPHPTQQPAPVVQQVHHYHSRGPDSGTAVILELLPGFFFQTFGIGNLYAGNTGGGLLIMFGYWASIVLNLFLCLFLIGFLTLPMTWIAFMIFSPIVASGAAKKRAYTTPVTTVIQQ